MKENKSKKIKSFFLWFFAVYFWLGGIGLLANSFLFGILTILLGIYICPKTDKMLKNYQFYSKNKMWIVIATVVLWVAMPSFSSIPETDEITNQNLEQLDTNTEEQNQNLNEAILSSENNTAIIIDTSNRISLSNIPPYSGMPYIEINDNVPFFDVSELTTTAYEKYSQLDELGRARIAVACIEKGMADKPRESISNVTPSGWQNINIDGENIYNRCHLIAHQLTGENDNENNLITGTRYFNTQGMSRFENMVADCINNTDYHVLYRVTPLYENDELMARGVLIEAESIEDRGETILFNVFCYNVQPNVDINYKTGEIINTNDNIASENVTRALLTEKLEENVIKEEPKEEKKVEEIKQNNEEKKVEEVKQNNEEKKVEEIKQNNEEKNVKKDTSSPKSDTTPIVAKNYGDTPASKNTYILNTNTKKFHYSWCSSVSRMKDKNKQSFWGTREEAINRGYSPCANCNP